MLIEYLREEDLKLTLKYQEGPKNMPVISEFKELTNNKIGIVSRGYQLHVMEEVLRKIKEKYRFIIISMPTGSGKTLIETFFCILRD